MNSSKPYMVRALYEWITDNNLTPHLVVDATVDGVDVPNQSVTDGQVVLNVSPSAVMGLELGNDLISFSARFSGVDTAISIPIAAVSGVYARENGKGMLFGVDDMNASPTDQDDPPPQDDPPSKKPRLKIVR